MSAGVLMSAEAVDKHIFTYLLTLTHTLTHSHTHTHTNSHTYRLMGVVPWLKMKLDGVHVAK